MKKVLKKTTLTFIITLLFLLIASEAMYGQSRRNKKENTDIWKYEIEGVQTGVQGTYLIKVWSYSPNANLAVEQAKKNAVHGIPIWKWRNRISSACFLQKGVNI